MLPPEGYQNVIGQWKALVEELNESTDGRLMVSSPYIVVLARKSARPAERIASISHRP
jgi:hypothetical protein